MFKSSSDRRLRTGFGIVLGTLLLSAGAFYPLQNSGMLPGGQVAPVKLAWLACAILFWYLLPGLLLLDGRLSRAARLAVTVLLANMLVRAVIELYMMYVTKNWHPWIGIGHDLFSFVLVLLVALPVFREPGRLYAGYLAVAGAMFLPEALFAWYMLTHAGTPVLTAAGAPAQAVYFVPDEPAHRGIMIVTAVCVTALVAYLASFSRRWLHA